MERRVFNNIEFRSDNEGNIEGYIAEFSKASQPLPWIEYIEPRAFDKSLSEKKSIKALKNHDSNFVLGNTAAKTLELKTDERGLFARIFPPNTTWANDLKISIQRGDVPGSSFGFRIPKNGDVWKKDSNGNDARFLREIILEEISVGVAFPAYEFAENISVRQMEMLNDFGIEFQNIVGVIERSKTIGYEMNSEDENIIERSISALQSLNNREQIKQPVQENHCLEKNSDDEFLHSLNQKLEKMNEWSKNNGYQKSI